MFFLRKPRRRRPVALPTMVLRPAVLSLGVFIAFVVLAPSLSFSFRIVGSDEQDRPFAAYETGFVGSMMDAHYAHQRLRSCPNDYSNAGVCNNQTGRCQCNEFREGDDCSDTVCSRYHKYCTRCNDMHCTSCLEGYGVDAQAAVGDQCVSCSTAVDPRCIDCNFTIGTCLRCIDPLLFASGSGPREQDPALPEDEVLRQRIANMPHGRRNLDTSTFDEAENYFVVDPELIPLNASTVACDQGMDLDASINCRPKTSSHVVCGSYGTVSFVSSEYEVREDANFVRLYVARTGGGVGTVSVTYDIEHLSTGENDVTSTAFYTTNQVLTLSQGVIQQSFLVAINDDRLLDSECFFVSLSAFDGTVQLGKQSKTKVCVIDDDINRTCSLQSERIDPLVDNEIMNAVAGESISLILQARTCGGQEQTAGQDRFHIVASRHESDGPFISSNEEATIIDNANGTYNADIILYKSGIYDLDFYQLIPGGLLAQYYSSAFLTEETHDTTRVDAVVNFTWNQGAVSSLATDFVSVRWEGVIISNHSETYTFYLDVDDNVRFWIDGILLIDAWDDATRGSGAFSSEHDLVKGRAHEILIEYRDLSGNARAKFLWSSLSTPKDVVSPASLYYMESIKGSYSRLHVRSARTNALTSTANGPALLGGVAGKDHTFAIAPRDEFGNLNGDSTEGDVLSGHDGFHGVATLLENQGGGVGSEEIPVDIRYNHLEHTYDATFSPTISGTYILNVTLTSGGLLGGNVPGDDHIHGSPFIVETFPDKTFAHESIAFGGYGNCVDDKVDNAKEDSSCSGIDNGLAGSQSTFYIQALDLYRNKRIDADGVDAWEIVLHHEGAAEYIRGKYEYEGNGLYTASVTPLVAGENFLSITLDGINIKGSPFAMNVRYASFDASYSLLSE